MLNTQRISNSNITSVNLINPFGDIILCVCVCSIFTESTHYSFNPCKHDIVIDIRYLVNTESYENFSVCWLLMIAECSAATKSHRSGSFCFRFNIFQKMIILLNNENFDNDPFPIRANGLIATKHLQLHIKAFRWV